MKKTIIYIVLFLIWGWSMVGSYRIGHKDGYMKALAQVRTAIK